MPTMTASTSTLMPDATTLPSTFSARKAVLLNRAKGNSTKPASVTSLNSIRVTKSCTEDEEGDEDDNPGDEQHRDLDEVGKEAAESHQIAHGVQQRFAGVEPGGGDAAGLHEIGETDAGAAGLQTETGEAVEHDAGERGEIADDEGEKADIEDLLDQAVHDVFVGTPGPEQTGQRDVDDDQGGGEEGDLATEQPEPAVDVAVEGVETG